MNKTMIVGIGAAIAGAVAVLVYMAAVAPPPPPPGPCPGSNPHCLVVSVITVGGVAQIPPIQDHYSQGPNVSITWEIGTVGYTFAANGIEFNSKADPLPPGEFACSLMSSTKFKCIDRGHTPGKFAYKVTLAGSPAVPPLDPFVINN